jgi:3'-(hydroxy)phthioceranyl-2'-palmitoyl(stearoyl)-2-O-sulfo-trehalose (hydroxy)phthioceranyltransferase
LKPMVDRAYGPDPGPLPNPKDISQVGHIGPAISIPIESTNAGITAGLTTVTTAVNAGNVISTVSRVVSGAGAAGAASHAALPAANAGKGAAGAVSTLAKVGGLLPKGKKKL